MSVVLKNSGKKLFLLTAVFTAAAVLCADEADERALNQKDAGDGGGGDAHRLEDADLTGLLNHHCDEGGGDGEGGNQHDEGHQKAHQEYLYSQIIYIVNILLIGVNINDI